MPEAGHIKPLDGLRIIDSATLFAGPMAASLLGDYGAEVIKLEHPRGDPARNHGPKKDGIGLWWKVLSRNKRSLGLSLSTPEGQALMKALVRDVDIWVENFRPGTLERWGLGYDVLSDINPGLILVRMTGFGQFGPKSHRPGFGTLAEAMSGFAALTGPVEGPPTLPPFGLGDGVAGITAAFAALTAIEARRKTGRGQIVDIALIEPLMSLLGPHAIAWDQLGHKQPRTGNRSAKNAPRNTYLTSDGKWVAVSTSSDTIAVRLMEMIGRPDIASADWYQTASGRVQEADLLDALVTDWIAERDLETVMAAFDAANAAAAPVYDIEDIADDPQMKALETITRVRDSDFGDVAMQNVTFRLSETPGGIEFTGRALGSDSDDILKSAAGCTDDDLRNLRQKGVIA